MSSWNISISQIEHYDLQSIIIPLIILPKSIFYHYFTLSKIFYFVWNMKLHIYEPSMTRVKTTWNHWGITWGMNYVQMTKWTCGDKICDFYNVFLKSFMIRVCVKNTLDISVLDPCAQDSDRMVLRAFEIIGSHHSTQVTELKCNLT